MAEDREVLTAGKLWPAHYTYVPALRVGDTIWLSGTTGTGDSGKIAVLRGPAQGSAPETRGTGAAS